ncbi:MAG: SGNH/GDSL hydrolase family protein [Butyrivibrio sp.]|nr:SGNH/GDSL hydrolase family protein [Butyrivibrio sp.]
MKKRFLVAAALSLAVTMALSACGNSSSGNAGTAPQTDPESSIAGTDAPTDEATEAAEPTNKAAAALTDYVSDEEMALADQWPSCDDRALAAVMRKAAKGEKVTIACIGGSITQGTISSGKKDSEVGFKKCYADIFFEWWKTTFPDGDFEFVNAGIGGTDSYLGVHRVEKDVLDKKPDLVLVEYSVNDADSTFYKRSYDNLVRKILLSDGSPAVMLLYMAQTNGSTSQGSHVFVGFNYELPMVSYSNVISDMMANNIFTAEELSGDTVHPSTLGHAITGEIIWKYLNGVYEVCDSLEEPDEFSKSPVTKDVYLDAVILDSTNVTPDSLGTFKEQKVCDQFPNGWVCSEGDGEITFTAEFSNLGILYYDTVDGKSGQFEIYIDGESKRTINADFTGGWGNAITAEEVYTSDEKAEHTVVIKKAPGSTGDVFDLLGLLAS